MPPIYRSVVPKVSGSSGAPKDSRAGLHRGRSRPGRPESQSGSGTNAALQALQMSLTGHCGRETLSQLTRSIHRKINFRILSMVSSYLVVTGMLIKTSNYIQIFRKTKYT